MKVHYEIVNEKPSTHRWWVYVHTTPDGMHYVGVSTYKHTSTRWQPSKYKTTALHEYIERFGWAAIEHTVVAYVNDEKLARLYEDALIKEFAQQGTLINKQGSGGHWRDNPKEYMCKYQQSEQGKAVKRKSDAKRRTKVENKIYQRVYKYNRYHDPIETPMEAKQRYLNEGIVPNYIKSDDLQ